MLTTCPASMLPVVTPCGYFVHQDTRQLAQHLRYWNVYQMALYLICFHVYVGPSRVILLQYLWKWLDVAIYFLAIQCVARELTGHNIYSDHTVGDLVSYKDIVRVKCVDGFQHKSGRSVTFIECQANRYLSQPPECRSKWSPLPGDATLCLYIIYPNKFISFRKTLHFDQTAWAWLRQHRSKQYSLWSYSHCYLCKWCPLPEWQQNHGSCLSGRWRSEHSWWLFKCYY